MKKYPPSPTQLRSYMDKHKLTSNEVGSLLQVSGRMVRYWCREDAEQDIPYTAWFTLRTKVEGEPPESQ